MEPGDILQKILDLSSPSQLPVYLVGGAVRDLQLGREIHDFDFVLAGDTAALARKAADAFNGAFYPLDEERGTYRVILSVRGKESIALDFAAMRAADLASDLRARDFTVNAMAMDTACPDELIDPLGGKPDLEQHVLRACATSSISDDPVRSLRAVRLELDLGLQVEAGTQLQIRQSRGLLERISHERIRDELFRIFDLGQAADGLLRLEEYGLLGVILPDLQGLKGMRQSPPHIYSGWEHTLEVVRRFDQVWDLIVEGTSSAENQEEVLFEMQRCLGRFQSSLAEYYRQTLIPMRSLRSLVVFSVLYHDVAKPVTSTTDASGRIRFFNHDERGARVAARRGRILALSGAEIERVETVIAEHMRVHLLVDAAQTPGPRAIYRYFRSTQQAGIDICLLSLADTLGTFGPEIPPEYWQRVLHTIDRLLEAYWRQAEQIVSPPRLITGNDLIQELGLAPGPLIGRILEAVREAQAAGEVNSRADALTLANLLKNEV